MPNPEIQLVPIEQVRLNEANPRIIKDARFEALKKSIHDFPEMLHTRPLVVDEGYTVLGGNMRLQALLQLKHTEVPVIVVTGWTEQQKREFVILDNASFGEWDWEDLANSWSDLPLQDWLDVPRDWMQGPEEDASGSTQPTESTIKITFTSAEQAQKAQAEFQKLLEKKYEGATLTLTVA